MLIVFVRALLLYLTIVIVMRVMGKRQVGQLQPFEFVLALLLADLAAVPMQNKEIPLINGFIPIFSLLFTQVIIAFINLKSQTARAFICGKPSTIIENGVIQGKTLALLNYNINDLLEQLRSRGYPDITEVEAAILETNGQLSVIPKAKYRPVRPDDLKLPVSPTGLPLTLIIDGVVDYHSLKESGHDWSWLLTVIEDHGGKDPTDVLYASLNSSDQVFCQLHHKAGKGNSIA